MHEEYEISKESESEYAYNDIALLRVKPKEERNVGIICGSKVQPLCLPSSKIQHQIGMNCKISGWGLTDNDDRKCM